MNSEIITRIIVASVYVLGICIPVSIMIYKSYHYGSNSIHIRNMILTYRIITDTTKNYDQVYKLFKKSATFNQIAEGNRLLMCKGYGDNLMSIVEELLVKEEIEVCLKAELNKIDRDKIRIVNTSRQTKRLGKICVR